MSDGGPPREPKQPARDAPPHKKPANEQFFSRIVQARKAADARRNAPDREVKGGGPADKVHTGGSAGPSERKSTILRNALRGWTDKSSATAPGEPTTLRKTLTGGPADKARTGGSADPSERKSAILRDALRGWTDKSSATLPDEPTTLRKTLTGSPADKALTGGSAGPSERKSAILRDALNRGLAGKGDNPSSTSSSESTKSPMSRNSVAGSEQLDHVKGDQGDKPRAVPGENMRSADRAKSEDHSGERVSSVKYQNSQNTSGARKSAAADAPEGRVGGQNTDRIGSRSFVVRRDVTAQILDTNASPNNRRDITRHVQTSDPSETLVGGKRPDRTDSTALAGRRDITVQDAEAKAVQREKVDVTGAAPGDRRDVTRYEETSDPGDTQPVAKGWSDATPNGRLFSDGSLLEVRPDGTIRLHHPDGRTVQEQNADGSKTLVTGDGSTVSVHAGGPIVASPDVNLRIKTDGDIEGSTRDGYTVRISVQGDFWVESPDGYSRGIAGDGTTAVRGSGGLSALQHKPKSLAKPDSDVATSVASHGTTFGALHEDAPDLMVQLFTLVEAGNSRETVTYLNNLRQQDPKTWEKAIEQIKDKYLNAEPTPDRGYWNIDSTAKDFLKSVSDHGSPETKGRIAQHLFESVDSDRFDSGTAKGMVKSSKYHEYMINYIADVLRNPEVFDFLHQTDSQSLRRMLTDLTHYIPYDQSILTKIVTPAIQHQATILAESIQLRTMSRQGVLEGSTDYIDRDIPQRAERLGEVLGMTKHALAYHTERGDADEMVAAITSHILGGLSIVAETIMGSSPMAKTGHVVLSDLAKKYLTDSPKGPDNIRDFGKLAHKLVEEIYWSAVDPSGELHEVEKGQLIFVKGHDSFKEFNNDLRSIWDVIRDNDRQASRPNEEF